MPSLFVSTLFAVILIAFVRSPSSLSVALTSDIGSKLLPFLIVWSVAVMTGSSLLVTVTFICLVVVLLSLSVTLYVTE